MNHAGLGEVLLEEFDDADSVIEQIKVCIQRDGYFSPHPDVLGVHDLNGACAPISVATENLGVYLPPFMVPLALSDAVFSLIAWRSLHPESSPPRPERRPPPQSSLCALPPGCPSDDTTTLTGHWTNGRHVIYRADSPKNAERTGYWYIGT